jgi:hypothetical protein
MMLLAFVHDQKSGWSETKAATVAYSVVIRTDKFCLSLPVGLIIVRSTQTHTHTFE